MELTVHTTSGFSFYSNIKAFLADRNLITLPEIKLTFSPLPQSKLSEGKYLFLLFSVFLVTDGCFVLEQLGSSVTH